MKAQRQLLQIGEVASQAKTTVRTVRYYLAEGLVESAERSPGGFYLFEPHTVDTVRFIQKLKSLGMSLSEIKSLYQVRREKPTGNEAYPVVLSVCKNAYPMLTGKSENVRNSGKSWWRLLIWFNNVTGAE